MDLKFSFGGASPDHHDHGGAPSGIPLPFAGAATKVSTSNVLDVVVRVDSSGVEPLVVAEVITGDGVTYSRSEIACDPSTVDPTFPDTSALARVVRSAISRAVAALEGPLALSITSIELQVPAGAVVVAELGADSGATGAIVSETLQARMGVNAGVPINAF